MDCLWTVFIAFKLKKTKKIEKKRRRNRYIPPVTEIREKKIPSIHPSNLSFAILRLARYVFETLLPACYQSWERKSSTTLNVVPVFSNPKHIRWRNGRTRRPCAPLSIHPSRAILQRRKTQRQVSFDPFWVSLSLLASQSVPYTRNDVVNYIQRREESSPISSVLSTERKTISTTTSFSLFLFD